MDLTNAQIIELAIDRAGAVNVYWNFYVVVATAILATMASGKAFTSSNWLKIFLSLGFLAFAQSNLGGILSLAEIRHSLLNLLPQDAVKYEKLISSLRPPKNTLLIGFHLLVDSIIILCIWFVPWPRND